MPHRSWGVHNKDKKLETGAAIGEEHLPHPKVSGHGRKQPLTEKAVEEIVTQVILRSSVKTKKKHSEEVRDIQ